MKNYLVFFSVLLSFGVFAAESYPELMDQAEKLMNRYQTYNDEVALAKEYEKDGRVLILAPESMYGLNTLSKSFEGLERMYRAGYAAAAAIPAFLGS